MFVAVDATDLFQKTANQQTTIAAHQFIVTIIRLERHVKSDGK